MNLNLTILADKMADYVTDQPIQSELFERPLESYDGDVIFVKGGHSQGFDSMLEELLEALYPEGLRKLTDYDQKHNKNYCQTLRVYLEQDTSVVDATRLLYIHRATFVYQIKRIKEITDLDLDDSDTRLYLRICFKLLAMEEQQPEI